jgi:CBS domain containing-hemolysin-like protein
MKLILVFFFVGCTAFFVAAEYAVLRSRMSRIDQMVAEGSKKAMAVKQIVARLEEYLSACQLGNTLTNLALGWLGESTIEQFLLPLFEFLHIPSSLESILSFLIAFLVLTFLEVVIGELVPKLFAIQKAEPMALLFARPLMIFFRITFPFSWLLNKSARFVTGLFGLKANDPHESTHTEAELRLVLSEGYKSGIINRSEFKYVTNIFELDDIVVKGIMVPRKEIVCLSQTDTLQEVINLTATNPFNRYPVIIGDDKDLIVGLVDLKEVLTDYIHEPSNKTMESYMLPILQVIETISAQDLLLKMQKANIHMAVIMDEYGGTSGLITIKDIIKKIFGDQHDNQDLEGLPMVETISLGHYVLSAKLLITEVNSLLKTNIEEEGIYTIGGWLLANNVEIQQNDRILEGDYEFIVKDMDKHQIKRIEVLEHKL